MGLQHVACKLFVPVVSKDNGRVALSREAETEPRRGGGAVPRVPARSTQDRGWCFAQSSSRSAGSNRPDDCEPRSTANDARKGALLRIVLNSGVPARPGTPDELLQPPTDMRPLLPDPVAKRGQVWRPAWQRKPSLPPAHSKQWPRAKQAASSSRN
jgi:hypothetical protein